MVDDTSKGFFSLLVVSIVYLLSTLLIGTCVIFCHPLFKMAMIGKQAASMSMQGREQRVAVVEWSIHG